MNWTQVEAIHKQLKGFFFFQTCALITTLIIVFMTKVMKFKNKIILI